MQFGFVTKKLYDVIGVCFSLQNNEVPLQKRQQNLPAILLKVYTYCDVPLSHTLDFSNRWSVLRSSFILIKIIILMKWKSAAKVQGKPGADSPVGRNGGKNVFDSYRVISPNATYWPGVSENELALGWLWLSPSAKQRRNPCSRSPPVYQDLSTWHDWPVKNAIVDLPIRLKGNLKRISGSPLSPWRTKKQGSRRCCADVTIRVNLRLRRRLDPPFRYQLSYHTKYLIIHVEKEESQTVLPLNWKREHLRNTRLCSFFSTRIWKNFNIYSMIRVVQFFF